MRVRAVRYLGHVWLTLMGEVMGFLPLRSPFPSFSTLSSDGRRRGQSSLSLLHLVGLVRPLLLLLNPPFRSTDPMSSVLPPSSALFLHRVDFPSLEVFQSTTLCRTLFLRELSELLSPQSGCANTAYNTLWFSVTMNRGPRPNYKRLVSLTSVC